MGNEYKSIDQCKTLVDFDQIKRLSDILSPDVIKINVAGFTSFINSPIAIIEPNSKDSSVELYEAENIEDFLPEDCRKARKVDRGNLCQKHREAEFEEFVSGKNRNPARICYKGGIHLRKPIIVGGKIVGLALGGGYKVASNNVSAEEKDKLEKIMSSILLDNKHSINERDAIYLLDRKNSQIESQSVKNEYTKFCGVVEQIERLSDGVFHSKRLATEGNFISDLFDLTRLGYTVSINEDKFKEMLVSALKKISYFCGYNKSLLLTREEKGGVFKSMVTVGFSEEVLLQPDENWEEFVKWNKIIFIEKNMKSLSLKINFDFRKLFERIKALTFAPSANCCFAYPISITPDYYGIFIFVNEFNEPLYSLFKYAKPFIDRLMEHLSTILKRYYAEKSSKIYFDRLSHEVLAPLGAIRNWAEFLKKRFNDLPEESKNKKLDDLLKECDRLVLLTDDFKIVTGKKEKIELQKNKIRFYSDIVFPIIYLLRPEADLKRIFIRYGDVYDFPELYVDLDRVKQIIYNIVLNAIKYSYGNTTIDVFFESKPEGYVVCIRNIGIGIPEGEDEIIFESGVRGSNASEIDARGSGQGLTISKELIEAHGGKIWFERGKTASDYKEIIFKVLFPVALKEDVKNG